MSDDVRLDHEVLGGGGVVSFGVLFLLGQQGLRLDRVDDAEELVDADGPVLTQRFHQLASVTGLLHGIRWHVGWVRRAFDRSNAWRLLGINGGSKVLFVVCSE